MLKRAYENHSLETNIHLGIEAGLGGTLLVLNGISSLEDMEITEWRLRPITSFRVTFIISPAVKGACCSKELI